MTCSLEQESTHEQLFDKLLKKLMSGQLIKYVEVAPMLVEDTTKVGVDVSYKTPLHFFK